MSADPLVPIALALPAACAALIPFLGARPNLREAASLAAAAGLCVVAWLLAQAVAGGARPGADLFEIVPGIRLAFTVEPLGALFACVAAGLWLVSTVYSIGYMRANAEHHQTRFYAFFALALASTVGVAFAANLFTLFVFYEALTLSTYPLVVHHGDDASRRAGRVYLGVLLGTSIGLFLVALGWTYAAAGTLDFRARGILDGHVTPPAAAVLLGLYAFGVGKAALMPVHRWLPAAMVAPAPVSALLHAVAVVKAGVFTLLKVAVYVFGLDFLSSSGASAWLAWVASASLLLASAVALRRDDLKARLAYSTISQLAYVTLGVALANPWAALAGALQIPFHAVGKITLFFCAGAITTATGRTQVSQLDGLGRRMPVVFGAFLLGALSVIGLPPLAGMWVKWDLIRGALDSGKPAFVLVLILSSLLNVGYLMSVVARAFVFPAPAVAAAAGAAPARAPRACVAMLVLTGLGCIVLFLYAGRIAAFVAPVFAGVGA